MILLQPFMMENVTFHKGSEMKNAIEEAGHIVLCLPPYSPDLNPIEKNGHRLKR